MTTKITKQNFFISGGTLPTSALSYVKRSSDDVLYKALMEGEFCYILTSRQMGKSSMTTQAALRFREAGVRIALLDFSGIGFNLQSEQWYNGLLEHLGRRLNLEDEIEDFCLENEHLSPLQRWQKTLRDVVLTRISGNIVVFMDEIDIVRSLPFSTDEFFAAIRACYNARVEDPEYERLTFCLLGVATPADLIRNPKMTPFNIGRRIDLRDFTEEEASLLRFGLGHDEGTNRLLMERIFYWTGGHPYLTQRLCREVAERTQVLTPGGVDETCRDLLLSSQAEHRDDNLDFVQQRLLPSDEGALISLLGLYEQVLRGDKVADNEAVALVGLLKLSGVVRVEDGLLKVRNRIYARVFDRKWVAGHMPGAEVRRQKAAFRAGVVRAVSLSSVVVLFTSSLALYAFQQLDRANSLAEAWGRALYAGNMRTIPDDWDKNDVGGIIELLSDEGVPPEVRDFARKEHRFEWGYWNRLCHLDQLTLSGSPQPIAVAQNSEPQRSGVNCVAVSPDGKYIASTRMNSAGVQVWDVGLRRVRLELKGLGLLNCVAFSRDGKRIAAGGTDLTGRVWDSATGNALLTLEGHTDQITAIGFTPDDKWIVTGSNDKTVCLWDAGTGHLIRSLKGHSEGITSVAISSNNTRIVSGSNDRTAKIWDLRAGSVLLTLKGHTAAITSVAISPDGTHIVTGSEDKTARIWDVVTGRAIHELRGYADIVQSVAYSPDDRRIVTGSWDTTARVVDSRTGLELFTLKGHTAGITSTAFSADGKHIVTGSFDNTIKVWDASRDPAVLTYRGHAQAVRAIAFSPDGKWIVTGSNDNTARVWNPRTGQLRCVFTGHSQGVRSVAFSPDGSRIVSGSYDHTALVWDARTGRALASLIGDTDVVKSAAFSPDGTRIVTGSADKSVRVWDAATGRQMLSFPGHTDAVTSVAFSPDGRRIVSGSQDTTARVWDAVTGRELLSLRGQQNDVYAPNYSAVYAAAFSPDGKLIATGGYDNIVTVWDAATGRTVRTLRGHTLGVTSVAFSGDSKRLVTGSIDKTARVWDMQTGRELLTLGGRHTNIIVSVAFSADGKTIATAGNDKMAFVYFSE